MKMFRLILLYVATVAFAGCARETFGAEPPPVKTPPKVKGFRPAVTVPRPVASGCGCVPGGTCGASFCRANGGTGCPESCPVKGAGAVPAEKTFALPPASSGNNCPGGRCEVPQTRPLLFPRLRGW